MMSEIVKIDPKDPEKSVLHRAVKVMSRGGIIVYPTDTLYGLGVSSANPKAMDRLYALKDRRREKPVSLMVNTLAQITQITGTLTLEENRLAKILFPGKITLLIPVRNEISIKHLQHLHRIGFRIPESDICQHLVTLNGAPVTTTSANRSAQDNFDSVREIAREFQDQVDLFLDAGPVNSKHGSSVLDISFSPPVLVREGDISRAAIEKKIGYPVSDTYPEKYRITFICTGNICRSPMAVGIMKQALQRTKYREIVQVDSAGTMRLPQTPAALEAVNISERAGIDLGNHLSQPVTSEIVLRANLIICLALDHYNFLVAKYPAFRDKIFLLKQWGRDTILTNPSVADPIGQKRDYFERIFKEIEWEIKRILPEISRRLRDFIIKHPKPEFFELPD